MKIACGGWRLSGLALAAGLTMAACGDEAAPINPDELALRASGQASGILKAAGGGVGFADQEGGALGTFGSGFGVAAGTFGEVGSAAMAVTQASRLGPVVASLLPGRVRRAVRPAPLGFLAVSDPPTLGERFDELAGDVEVLLRDRILVASNLESKSAAEAIYLLKPDPTCRPLPSAGGTDVDADCADTLTKLPVRAALTADGDGARVRFLLGTERAELFALIVHADLLAAESSLADTRRAALAAEVALGEGDGRDDFSSLSGKVRVGLAKLGANKAKLDVAVLDAIDAAYAPADASPATFHTDARRPLLTMTADGDAQTLALAVDLGRTDFGTPWDPRGTGARNTDQHVVLGGFTAAVTLSERSDELVVTGLGLGGGPTHLDVRGTTLYQIDLNASDGRKLDLRALATAAGATRIEMKPKLDVALTFNLAAVAAELDSPPAAYLLDEAYAFAFAGAGQAAVEPVEEDAATGFPGGLRLAQGGFALTSNKVATPFLAREGQCLVSKTPAAGDHPVLGALGAVDCP